MRGVLGAVFAVLLCWTRLTCADLVKSSPSDAVCWPESVRDLLLRFRDNHCFLHGRGDSIKFVGVREGDEAALQRAITLVQKNYHEYVAVLFYASWCPFSRLFRPSFSVLSSLYPSIPHFAIEESSVRPSILSKYGVHGFPTLVLLNSTMRIRYHGPRSLNVLLAFYKDVTGVEASSLEQNAIQEIKNLSNLEKHGDGEVESCPFWWARSPENMLQQETYLALATIFVLMRLIYILYPTLVVFGIRVLNYARNMRLLSSLENFLVFLRQAVQPHSLIGGEPCKRSNLQEGAMNAAGVWASKSLATVSIGEASTSRRVD